MTDGEDVVSHRSDVDQRRVCFLMRGLPSTGKSHKARRLAGDNGVICETDEFFRTQLGSDPNVFDYDSARMREARDWNFKRFCLAVDRGASPIIVDRGNGLSTESRRYALHARERGYRVELAEPDSEWWAEIRVLLKYRRYTAPVLKAWAVKLAEVNRDTHRVSARKIWSRMQSWRHGLRVEDILTYRQSAGTEVVFGSTAGTSDQSGTEPKQSTHEERSLELKS